MSSYSYMSTPNQNQTAVWIDYEGSQKLATKWLGDWYITDDNGKRVKVDPNDIFGMNTNLTEWPQHFVDSYQKDIDKKEADIDLLKKTEARLSSVDLVDAKKEYENYLSSIGADDFNDITERSKRNIAEDLMGNIYNVKHTLTTINNKLFSKYNSLFNDVLAQGKWNNQLTVARQVQNSLS